MMKVICFEHKGGYEMYGFDIKDYMKNIFTDVKVAYICFMADDEKDATEIGKNYFNNKDILDGNFQCNGDSILIEFTNGNKVEIWNSEWGGIRVIN